MLMKKYYPEYDMVELRDAAKIRPYSLIYKMLKRLPEAATREEILELIHRGNAKVVFVDEEFEPWMKEIREYKKNEGDEVREAYSFSGTTFREMLRTERVKLPKVKPTDP